MSPSKVLVVEDDLQISKSLKMSLSLSGHEVVTAGDLTSARDTLAQLKPDIVLLDINLPDGNGLDFCHELRLSGNDVPLIFLSARTDEETVVKGMNIGADDYLRKPFGMDELQARMNRALKRAPPVRQTMEVGDLQLDVNRRSATFKGQFISLSRREFDILTVLCKKAGDVVTREFIIEYLGESSDLYDRTIDSHVSHLRRKLRDVAAEALQIVPVYGVGYRLHWIT